MRNCRHGLTVAWFIVLFGLSAQVVAQQDAGTLRILAEDQSGGVVPGALVKVTNVNTNTSNSAVTSSQGYAMFSPIPRGTYSVEVSMQGFATVRINSVGIDVNQNRLEKTVLQVAATAETVEVSANAAALQTEDASVGQTVKGEVISELPLATRRYTDLTLLSPGSAPSTADTNIRGAGWLVVNGAPHTMNNYILDGLDNNQNTDNMQSRSAQVVSPSPDTLNEFKVQTNSFSAEFGRAAGAVINASIKSGTNTFHGSAWEYNRDASLAANSWENNWRGAKKDNLKWNQFGGTFGGPIMKDKLFFFSDYEGFRSNVSDARFITVPSVAQRTGDFSALTIPVNDPVTGKQFEGNKIPSSRFDSLALKVLALYPQPNYVWPTPGTGGRPLNNYTAVRATTQRNHKADGRVDWFISGKDRIFGRYSFSQETLFKEPTMPGMADTGAQDGGRQYARNQAVGVGWNRVFSNAVVNELRFGYNKTYSDFVHATAGMQKATEFGFKGIPSSLDTVGGLPTMGVTNYAGLGTGPWRPQFQAPHSYQITETLSMLKGAHTLKVGFDYRHKLNDYVDLQYRTMAYSFQGLFTNDAAADMLLGLTQSVSGSTFYEGLFNQNNSSFYIQDDWKLRRNLTVNLGLRYEYATPKWGDKPFTNVNYDYEKKQLVVAPGGGELVYGARRGEDRYLQTPDRNNWGPRFGLAYEMNRRLVVRGGFGLFYNGEDINGSNGNLLLNPPNVFVVTLARQGTGPTPLRLSDAVPSNFLDPTKVPSTNMSVNSRAWDFIAGTVYSWNVSLQLLATTDSTFEAAYVGNRGRNLNDTYNPNRTPWGVDGSIVANLRFPGFRSLSVLEYQAKSNYNSVQVKYEKRFTASWYNLTSYTYASSMNEAASFGGGAGGYQEMDWSDPIRPHPIYERAFNGQLSRQRVSMSNLWKLPFGRGRKIGGNMHRLADFLVGGWQTQLILTARSGLPVNVTMGTTGVNPATGKNYTYLTNSGGGQIRPNRVASNVTTGLDPATDRLHYLSAAAFEMQAVNTPGNSARMVAWGPGLWNADVGLTKRFKVTEGRAVDFRFEMFNALNHTNYSNPAAVFGASTFGQITSAASPRQIQIALRFSF